MKISLFFLVSIAMLFSGCEEKTNLPDGMKMEEYANYKKLGFSDEQIAKAAKKKKSFFQDKIVAP